MAKAAPQNKEVLGYYRERRENTNILSHNNLLLGVNREARYETGAVCSRDSSNYRHLSNG